MTKDRLNKLFLLWKKRRNDLCECKNHHLDNLDVCMREKSWRIYCLARNEYLGITDFTKKEIDLDAILDSFEGMDQ
jgi:hypothetical protein